MTAKTPFPQVGGWTPGPWVTLGDGIVRATGGAGIMVNPPLKLGSGWREDAWTDDLADDETLANARLIAAAPELLEALRDMLTCSQPQDSSKPGFVYVTEAQEKAANAIKKATQP